MTRGLTALSTSYPSPSLSSVPAAKFSITTSTWATRRLNNAVPRSDLRFSVMPFLLELSITNG